MERSDAKHRALTCLRAKLILMKTRATCKRTFYFESLTRQTFQAHKPSGPHLCCYNITKVDNLFSFRVYNGTRDTCDQDR